MQSPDYSTIPFFLDRSLTKNFKVFGQILHVYFDPAFRRHVSVVDIGLKQKSTIFIDEIFKFRSAALDNNFQFSFLKKKDIFSLKPVHFLSSKNERVLRRKYLSSLEKRIELFNLNFFSILSLQVKPVFSKSGFVQFNKLAVSSFLVLKKIQFMNLNSCLRGYNLFFISFFRLFKKTNKKFNLYSNLLFFIKFWESSLLYLYRSLHYLNLAKTFSEAQHFIFWFNSFKKQISNQLLNLLFTSLRTSGRFPFIFRSFNMNKFNKFKSEKELEVFFNELKKTSNSFSGDRRLKLLKNSLIKKYYLEDLNENKSLLTLPKFNLGKVSKLLFSFNLVTNPLKIKNNFLSSYTNSHKVLIMRKLRTKNYFAVLSRGCGYALVNRLSFFNIHVFKGSFKKILFRNWLKFLFYFEKFNYLLILNNEEISFELKNSSEFFNSVYFPLIFNFRNLFFYFVRFFQILKIYQEKFFHSNSRFIKYRKKKFNSKFFGVLLRFLLLYNNKNLNKTPKNLLLNFFQTNLFDRSQSAFNCNRNGFNLLKTIIHGLFQALIKKVEYLYLGFLSEKLTNRSLIKLLFVNFSLGFNSSEHFKNQVMLIQDTIQSKPYSLYEWNPAFQIFKSLKIVSKQARKYKKKPNFSKRRRFKPIFKKRNFFLAPGGLFFKPQKFKSYLLRHTFFNSHRWSDVAGNILVSPNISRYGAYLGKINKLSKRYGSKVRVFKFKFFKNRMNSNFDANKAQASMSLYFQKFFNNFLSNKFINKKLSLSFRKDRYASKWDKYQNYLSTKIKQNRDTYVSKSYNAKTNNFKSRTAYKSRFPIYKRKFAFKSKFSRN